MPTHNPGTLTNTEQHDLSIHILTCQAPAADCLQLFVVVSMSMAKLKESLSVVRISVVRVSHSIFPNSNVFSELRRPTGAVRVLSVSPYYLQSPPSADDAGLFDAGGRKERCPLVPKREVTRAKGSPKGQRVDEYRKREPK